MDTLLGFLERCQREAVRSWHVPQRETLASHFEIPVQDLADLMSYGPDGVSVGLTFGKDSHVLRIVHAGKGEVKCSV